MLKIKIKDEDQEIGRWKLENFGDFENIYKDLKKKYKGVKR